MPPEKWFVPNLFAATDAAPVGTITTRYNATESAASFDGDGGTDWADFLDEWEPYAVEFYAGTVQANTDSILTRAIPMLAARGIKLAITSAGPRGYSPGITPGPEVAGDGTNGSTSAARDIATTLAAVEALGGTVDFVFMDSATRRTIQNGSNSAPHAAYRALGTVAANNAIRYVAAVAGADGNAIRVRYLVSGLNTSLSVDVTTDATTHLQDAFTRSVSGGWGTPDTGAAWSLFQTAADYNVTGTAGTQTVNAAATQRRAASVNGSADQVGRVKFSLDTAPTGNTHVVGIWPRWTSDSDHYRINVNIKTDASMTVAILKAVSGAVTTVASETTVPASDGGGGDMVFQAGVSYWLAFRCVGTTITARVWEDGDEYPASALISTTDSNVTTGNGTALAFAANSSATGLPRTCTFDDLVVTSTYTSGDITINVATDGAGAATSTATQALAALRASPDAMGVVVPTSQSGSSGAGVLPGAGYTSLLYGDDGYNFTAEQTAAEIVSYMETWLASRPNVKFIWHDSFVLAPYAGVAGYSGNAYPSGQMPDAETTIDVVLGALDDAGILDKLHAVCDDWAWEFAEGLVPSQNATAESNWYTRMHAIDAQVRGWGVGIQRDFVTGYGGTPGYPGAADDGYTASDQTFQELCIDFVRGYIANRPDGYAPLDGIRAQSFNYHPRTLAPESTRYSLLDTAARIWGAYGLVEGAGVRPRLAVDASAPRPTATASAPRPTATASAPRPQSR